MEVAGKKFTVPKPVSPGDVIEVRIESVNGHGDGIGRVDDFTIFVKGARKGERCKARIIEVKRTYATAEKIDGSSDEDEMEEEVEGRKRAGPSG